jgi:hypothetical protein
MKVGEHFIQGHKDAIALHEKMAKSARAQAKSFRALHAASGAADDATTPHSELADQCDEQANLHDQAVANHEAAMEACSKAAEDALNKLVPDDIRGVVPPYPGVTAIPRAGAPPMGSGQRPNVPLEFAKLFEVDDDD